MNVFKHHPRRFGSFRYVYPVISRRSGGLSLGVNVSPTALCNFACVYCQVIAEEDGHIPAGSNHPAYPVDVVDKIETELRQMIHSYNAGSLFHDSYLESTPAEKRQLRDIAFSGDGEPTLFPQFGEAVKRIIGIRNELCSGDVKNVVITNASTLHIPAIADNLMQLAANNGEIWAKLDAGTEAFFSLVASTAVPFQKVLSNLESFSLMQPVIIQTCFFNFHGNPPDEHEIRAYSQRLNALHQVRCVQIYTVARTVPKPFITSLQPEQLDTIANTVANLTGLRVERYY
jgi:wyosine [tRNA(Phe)-imidazoG37] synthetase (radical SAM superfamily)